LIDSGLADEDLHKVFAVVSLPQQLKRSGGESLGFVIDE